MGWGRSKASGPFLSQSCSHCLRSPCKYVFPLCVEECSWCLLSLRRLAPGETALGEVKCDNNDHPSSSPSAARP